MMQSGAIQATAETSFSRGVYASTPVHDLNVPYEATEEYQTPTAEMLFPPTPIQTPLQEPVMYNYLPPGPSEPPEGGFASDVKAGVPAPYMQPNPWMTQKQPLGVDVNVAYDESIDDEEAGIGQPPVTKDFFTLSTTNKRKREDFLAGSFIPQQDGAGDTSSLSLGKAPYGLEHSTSSTIPQSDGVDDNYDDDVAEEDYNEPGEEEQQASNDGEVKAAKAEGAESDGSEPPLNEDDDLDDLDDLDEGDEASKTEHLVVAQFEKVTRSKNKWKCILKDGVMHLNKRDYLFSKANGEFEF